MEIPALRYTRTSDGAEIAYWEAGDGPKLVVTPPLRPFSDCVGEWSVSGWREWNEALARIAHVVRYDPRGVGMSTREMLALNLDAQLEDLDAVVRAVAPDGEKVALLGTYGGAPSAIAYAARNPERVSHLILWCGAASREQLIAPGRPSRELDFLIQNNWEMFAQALSHSALGWDAGESARQLAELIMGCITPESAKTMWVGQELTDVRPELAAVRCPTLVIHRAGLTVLPLAIGKGIAAGIPGATLYVVPGSSLATWVGDTMGEILDVIERELHPPPA